MMEEIKHDIDISTTGEFYSRFKQTNAHFNPKTFECAEDTLEGLLHTATTSEKPGMLLGKVQSGKTRTFISILALAFDNTYDAAIVLTKNSCALAKQTEKRLKKDFAMFIDDGLLQVFDILDAPAKFNRFELQSKLVLVAKKETKNLKRLEELFSQHAAMRELRVLVIDDEADTCTIGYTKKNGEIDARTIAKKINGIRSCFAQSSFLQVTATPYSLYLQPSEIEVPSTQDFKPVRPAFTKLLHVPEDYVGGDTYFGERARSETDTLESLIHYSVDHAEFGRLKKQDGRSFKLDDVLVTKSIEGYRSAILNFIVGGSILMINGQKQGVPAIRLRYSFLLHSEAGKDAHDWQERLTNTIVDKLTEAADSDVGLFTGLIFQSFQDLQRSLSLASFPTPDFDELVEFVKKALKAEYVTITKVNSDEDIPALLDDDGQLRLRTPLCIFVGGQAIDRGITLAKLIGFYYGRRPNRYQQDTVVQHSRMYGYRRNELPVTRFYTSPLIRHALSQMEDFDSSLRTVIQAGGDGAVQFIRKANDGSIIPCSPNKILIASTEILRPHKRIIPIGFNTGYRTGAHGIESTINSIDQRVRELCGFNSNRPVSVPLSTATQILDLIASTLIFSTDEDEEPPFDWTTAKAALTYLSNLHSDPSARGNVLLWAADDRNSSRLAGTGSHAKYIETPDSDKTEGKLAREHAINSPILFLLRQNGLEEKGWRGTPFYWPVIRAQSKTPTAVYTAETTE